MYLDHYKLTAKPFSIAADSKFLWLGEKHQEALAVLKYGVLDNKGFLLLTGDVGTGKTTLIHALLKSLGEDVLTASLPDSGLDRMDFYNFVIHAFRLNKTFSTKGEFLIFFEKFLKYAQYKGLKVLLIVDEAQRLSSEVLEEIRVLSNFERDGAKLLNIFFVGQNEFNEILREPRNKALRQRITITYNLKPLSRAEIKAYVEYRLSVAGVSGREIFSAGALEALFRLSGGYPRRINVLCDHALLTGFVKSVQEIDAGIVEECAAELEIPENAVQSGGLREASAAAARANAAAPVPEEKAPAWELVKEEVGAGEAKPDAGGKLGGVKAVAYAALLIVGMLAAVFWMRPDIYTRSVDAVSKYFAASSGPGVQNTVTQKIPGDPPSPASDPSETIRP